MPDAKQRAQDALEHIRMFEQGALADVKTELAKIAGLLQANGDPVPDAEPAADEAPVTPAAPAAAPAKPATGS
jgi:hypothetical protein